MALTSACSRAGAPPVVAADGVLCDITRRLAAEAMPVVCLLGPNDDPHRFQLSPRQSEELRRAQRVLINGYGLTPALQRIAGTVAVAEVAVPDSPHLRQPSADHDPDHGPDQGGDADHGHAHGDRDPHVWHDPRQAQALVEAVSRELQALQPRAATAIRRREQAMRRHLVALHRWNQQQFATLPARPGARTLATGHRSLSSLSRAYNLQELAVVDGLSSSDNLRPQAMATAVTQLRQRQPAVLFSEQWPAGKALSRISALSGIPLASAPLRTDGLSADGPDLLSTLTGNTCLIVNSSGGRCDRTAQQQLIQTWQAIR